LTHGLELTSIGSMKTSLRARAACAALALGLASCAPPAARAVTTHGNDAPSAPSTPTSSNHPSSALAARPAHWRIGTTGDYAPFSTRAADGQPQGFDIDVVRAMAHDLNAELEWVSVRWPTLQASLVAGEFDVAMSGVTWQPARGVVGYMTRAVARGGPCVLGDAHGTPVGVNRGGVLEAWARAHWSEAQLVTVDDNQSLPGLLASGRVQALVTDSFELRSFARPGWASHCEPRLARKVYWIAPGHEALAQSIDGWLATHGEQLQAAQERWFGERQPLRALDHLSDLLARRLAFMPFVAAAKAKAGLPIEDLPREQLVLDATAEHARQSGLPEARVRDFFALQIALAKAIQRRKSEAATLDLGSQIRPALNELGDRILDAIAGAARAGELRSATLADLEPLTPWLEAAELARLLEGVHALGG
jgi:cyclohexadienyl dehydratase